MRNAVRRAVGLVAASSLALAVVATLQPSPAYAVDPVVGAQTSGDSLFPNQGNGGYDVSHYDISLSVNVAVSSTSNAVSSSTVPAATAAITATTTGAPLSSYSLDFQGSAGGLDAATLNVDSVSVDGQPASFSRIENTTTGSAVTDKHKLVVTPATPVSGSFTTVVKYSGKPVAHTDTDGSSEGWNNTTDGATFLNQPVGSMTLFPNNNTPHDKATYTFTVDAPSTLTTSNYANAGGKPYQAGVVSNGELVSRTPSADGSRTTWVWDETRPMASELSLVSVGRYDIYQSTIDLASGRSIPEWTFIDPAISVANQTTTLSTRAQLKPLLDFYETKYGPYPGKSTGIVTDVVPSVINYALETQDRPFFPNSAGRGTTSHEIMHQWWGDAVAPTDWNDITLNEGPATYAESQFPYEGSGSSATSTEQAIYNSWNNTSATSSTFTIPAAAMTQASQLFGSQVYAKGAMTLEALRTAIGAGNFETLMRQYQLTYGGGQIAGRRTAAFQALAESISGRDLTAFFQSWWFSNTKPAWPVKYNLNLAGPAAQVNPGDSTTYALSVRNTGKVAMTAGAALVAIDASDLLDDATIDSLPAGVTQNGTTLTWSVPATPLATTSTVTIPVTLNPGTAGNTLKAVARATTLGSTCIDCAPTAVVGNTPISPSPVPTITGGPPIVGQTLTADTSGWDPNTTFTYQWLIDGTPVPGATSATYTPTGDVVGFPVTVRATGRQAGFNATTQASAATPNGARATPSTSVPTISGQPKIGVPLTVDPGAWQPGTVFTYQWLANGTAIAGASGPSYTPAVSTQVGQAITVTVTGTRFGFTTTPRTSAPTGTVAAGEPLDKTPTPSLPAAAPKVGVVYAPSYGSWDDGVNLGFQWQANGTNITGAVSGSYTPTSTQLGQALTVVVTGTKPGISPVVRTSAVSAAVDPGTQTLQPTPSITGTPRSGATSTGVPGSWDSGTTLTYQWVADGTAIPGATALTYTPTNATIGSALTFVVTSVKAGYSTVTKSSAPKTVLALAQTLTPTPTVTGPAKVGRTLTGDPGTWDDGTTLTYQWLADGIPLAGATGLTFTPTSTELGKAITFAVTSTRTNYETVTKTSAPTANVGTGDLVSTPKPTITGQPKVGSTLTAHPGSWDDGVTFDYQWAADGTPIPGATDVTYTLTPNRLGKAITVDVTGSKPGYTSVTRTSDPTDPAAPGDLSSTPTPTITGEPKIPNTLTAVPGSWDNGVTFTYQWAADGTPIPGATDVTYMLTPNRLGKAITVAVTGSKPGYTSVTSTSDPTDPVAPGDLDSTPTPTISGAAKVGRTLTADAGTWDPGTTLSYQWAADGTAIAGATDVTYTITPNRQGKTITVAVTGSKPGYTSVTRTSDATPPVALGELVDTPTPTISGQAKIPGTLTAHPGSWDDGVTFDYQWAADGTPIPGATDVTYTLTPNRLGQAITVSVTGSKPGYTSVTSTSDPTDPVAAGDLSSTPTPTITGEPKIPNTLTAVPGSWDNGVTFTYQWAADGTPIPGATDVTYMLTPNRLGKAITVAVTGSKPGYTAVTSTSDPTDPVTPGDLDSTPTPTVTGQAKIPNTLTAVPGSWDNGVTLSYQWAADGNPVAGATSDTFTLTAANLGKAMTVAVTGTKPGYTAVTTTSDPTDPVAPGDLTDTPTPTITGTVKVGATLTAEPGSWDPGTTFSYQWSADGSAIAGATGKTYVPVPGDQGAKLRVRVTGSKPGYTSVATTSTPTRAVAPGTLVQTPTPTITGIVEVGETLTAHAGNWGPGTTLAYQWYVRGQLVAGATTTTYVPAPADVGAVIVVRVTGSKPGYASATEASDPTVPVPKIGTSTTLSSSDNPAPSGSDVVLTSTTTSPDGPVAGRMTFVVTRASGARVACAGGANVTLDASGEATCRLTGLKVGFGPYTVTATYAASARYAASTANLTQRVVRSGSTTTISPASTPAPAGQALPITIRVSPLVGAGVATGVMSVSVTTSSGVTVACNGSKALSDGAMTCKVPAGSVTAANGPLQVEADYPGSTELSPSTRTRSIPIA